MTLSFSFSTLRGNSVLKTVLVTPAILTLFKILSLKIPSPSVMILPTAIIKLKDGVGVGFFPENCQHFDHKVSTYYERKIWIGQSCEKPVSGVIDTTLLIWHKNYPYLINKNRI
jgi:hypothetical protein